MPTITVTTEETITVESETTEETTITDAVALGGAITLPADTEWFYIPPLVIQAGTTMTVAGGGTATLTPSQVTPVPVDDPESNAILARGDDISLTGIIAKCLGLAGNAFRLGGQRGILTDCQANGFKLKGFSLRSNGLVGPALTKWTGLSATSIVGQSHKNLVGYQCDTGAQQSKRIEILNCSVGVLTGGLDDIEIALKLATADVVIVTNLGFDQDTQRLTLAEGLGVVQLLDFDWSRGRGDWLQIAPDIMQPDRNQNVRELFIWGASNP